MYFLKDIQQRPIKKTDLQKILFWRNNKTWILADQI